MIETIARRTLPFALFVVCFLMISAEAVAQGPVLVLGDGSQQVDRLVVGEDLWVDLPGFVPDGRVEIHLRWPSGEVIAAIPFGGEPAPVPPGDGEEAAGSGGYLLWPASGVIDCDCSPRPPAGQRFADFEQAEQVLGGQVLTVEVIDEGGQVLATTELPAVVPQERIYFSDSLGCLREVYGSNETIWVSMLRPPVPRPPSRSLVLSAAANETVADVRGAAQALSLPQYGARLMMMVDSSGLAVPGGPYFGFVHDAGAAGGTVSPVGLGPPAGPTPPSGSATMVVARRGTGHPNGGITITMDGCIPDRP